MGMPRAEGSAVNSPSIPSHSPHPGRKYSRNRLGSMMRDLAPAAIDLHRVGDELDGLSGDFANGSDLMSLHHGGESVPRADPSESLHRRLGLGVRRRYHSRIGTALFDEY